MIRQDLESRIARPGPEPVIGNLSPAELAEDRSGPSLGPGGGQPVPQASYHPETETEERRLAQALGALIRERGATRPAAAASGYSAPAVAGPADPWWDEPLRQTPPRPGGGSWLSFRRLLDLLGISLTLPLFWLGYQAFLALPEAPTQSPWALLGSARQETAAAPPANLAAAPARTLPPIGQFDFGQTVAPTDTPPALPALIRQEPVELYRSIYELEDAFEAKYVPPAGCAGLDTQAGVDITACINHRLSARRAFLASNGRSLEPDEPIRVRRPAAGTEMEGEEGWR